MPFVFASGAEFTDSEKSGAARINELFSIARRNVSFLSKFFVQYLSRDFELLRLETEDRGFYLFLKVMVACRGHVQRRLLEPLLGYPNLLELF